MDVLRNVVQGLRGTSVPTRVDYRATTLPQGYRRLIQGPALEVHGEPHYRAAIEAVVGRRPEGHHDIVDAVLVPEPDNPVDPNAIMVQIDGRTCGYLPKLEAKHYQPVMEWARSEGFVPVVRAEVTGASESPDGWADFEIRLYVASPDQIMGRQPVGGESDATTGPV